MEAVKVLKTGSQPRSCGKSRIPRSQMSFLEDMPSRDKRIHFPVDQSLEIQVRFRMAESRSFPGQKSLLVWVGRVSDPSSSSSEVSRQS